MQNIQILVARKRLRRSTPAKTEAEQYQLLWRMLIRLIACQVDITNENESVRLTTEMTRIVKQINNAKRKPANSLKQAKRDEVKDLL